MTAEQGYTQNYSCNEKLYYADKRRSRFRRLANKQTILADEAFVFPVFEERMGARGYVVGRAAAADKFRIGCGGRLYGDDVQGLLSAVREILTDMDVRLKGH